MKRKLAAIALSCMLVQTGMPLPANASEDGRFTASFLQGWLCRDWTAERWQQEFAAASDAGMDALILQSVCDLSHTQSDAAAHKQDASAYVRTSAYAMYPSALDALSDCTLSAQNDGDALALALEAARQEDMQLWIGTVSDDRWWNYGWGTPAVSDDGTCYFAQWSEENAMLCAKVVEEIQTRYGEAYGDTIAGYYYVNELWNIDAACARTDGGQYAAVLGENINATLSACGEEPLMISPFFNPDLSDAAQYGAFWADIFRTADFRTQDVFAHQDGGGRECTPEVIREWALALKTSADAEGLRFWINNETFQGDYASKPIADLRANVEATADLAGAHILFSWNHYYNPLVDSSKAEIGAAFLEYALTFTEGDVNGDGIRSVLDAVMFQKYLLGAGVLTAPAAGELCKDGVLNGFDLCLLKRMLLRNDT